MPKPRCCAVEDVRRIARSFLFTARGHEERRPPGSDTGWQYYALRLRAPLYLRPNCAGPFSSGLFSSGLDPARFLRIHRSAIVNLEFVDQIGLRGTYSCG